MNFDTKGAAAKTDLDAWKGKGIGHGDIQDIGDLIEGLGE